jgi:hypothetical protein
VPKYLVDDPNEEEHSEEQEGVEGSEKEW